MERDDELNIDPVEDDEVRGDDVEEIAEGESADDAPLGDAGEASEENLSDGEAPASDADELPDGQEQPAEDTSDEGTLPNNIDEPLGVQEPSDEGVSDEEMLPIEISEPLDDWELPDGVTLASEPGEGPIGMAPIAKTGQAAENAARHAQQTGYVSGRGAHASSDASASEPRWFERRGVQVAIGVVIMVAIIAAAIAVALAVVPEQIVQETEEASEQAANVARTDTVEVVRGSLERTVDGTGVLEPVTATPVNGSTAGKVASVSVRKGDEVEKGDTLFTLEGDGLEKDLDAAEEERDDAKADLDKAQGAYEDAYEKQQDAQKALDGLLEEAEKASASSASSSTSPSKSSSATDASESASAPPSQGSASKSAASAGSSGKSSRSSSASPKSAGSASAKKASYDMSGRMNAAPVRNAAYVGQAPMVKVVERTTPSTAPSAAAIERARNELEDAQSELDKAEKARDEAQDAYDEADADYQKIRDEADELVVKAPCAGTVTFVHVSRGDRLSDDGTVVSTSSVSSSSASASASSSSASAAAASTDSDQAPPAVVIADFSAYVVKIPVNANDAPKLKQGQEAHVTLANSSKEHKAAVFAVSPEPKEGLVDATGAAAYEVVVGLPEPTSDMHDGMEVEVSIVSERHINVLLVPTKAIRVDAQNGPYLEVKRKGEDTFNPLPVQIIASEADKSAVRGSGLLEGAEVVVG